MNKIFFFFFEKQNIIKLEEIKCDIQMRMGLDEYVDLGCTYA